MIYNKIYEFCKVRNKGTSLSNGVDEYPPRVKFIINLLEDVGIEYEVDTFLFRKNNLHNIYLKGSSNNWIMAHHDVYNHKIDNANDNSASVINAIALKLLRPDMNIALVDGEEAPCFGAGSKHFSERTLDNTLNVNWVLNLELTGSGGTNFFIGNYETDLTKKIKEKFNCATMNVPFNDATILIRDGGINAALINPCPLKSNEMVIKQVGIVNDLTAPHDYIMSEDELYDQIGDEFDTYEDFEDFYDDYNRDKLDEFNEYGSLNELSVGDILSKVEFDIITKKLKQFKYSPKNDSEKFIVEKSPIVIPEGTMPTLDQMDTSILYRCHTSDDTIDYIRPNEMKDFVEKVLIPICDLS